MNKEVLNVELEGRERQQHITIYLHSAQQRPVSFYDDDTLHYIYMYAGYMEHVVSSSVL